MNVNNIKIEEIKNLSRGDVFNLLKESHFLIKIHPYRENGEKSLFSDYKHLCRIMMDSLYNYTKYSIYKNACLNMYHDFLSTLYRQTYLPEEIQYLELVITTIHKFIETKEIKEYYTYYGGCNIPEGVNRLRRHFFHNGKFLSLLSDLEIDKYIETYPKNKEYYEKARENIKIFSQKED